MSKINLEILFKDNNYLINKIHEYNDNNNIINNNNNNKNSSLNTGSPTKKINNNKFKLSYDVVIGSGGISERREEIIDDTTSLLGKFQLKNYQMKKRN